ncbi:amino acid permease [Paenactinomyces guangxiensis]|uniref:amino acid permease n=1 Tax=Paenactinomyces guangxiensis TaxID=1490290 RepID=UPI002867D1AF|nr:amino acid permease [Paenactinomyces guangxiensis]
MSFIIAGLASAAAALCYAEFSGLIPVAGSTYTYSYTVLGEFVAWMIGWDLILEYAPVTPIVGIIASIWLIIRLPPVTWGVFPFSLGIVLYFLYGICHSELAKAEKGTGGS